MELLDEFDRTRARRNQIWWERPAALLLAIHGLGHLVGVRTARNASAAGDSVDYFFDALTVASSRALSLIGLIWTVITIGFVATAYAVWTQHPAWRTLMGVSATVSLGFSFVALPQTAIGLIVDVILIGVFAVTSPAR